MSCKNCGQAFEAKYCDHCGQSARVDRIDFPYFLNQLSSGVFQVDSGLFYSFKELLTRPGHSIREYLDGKRKPHFKPVAYAFTLSAVYFLVLKVLGVDAVMGGIVGGLASGFQDEATQGKGLATFAWLAENYAILVLFLIPLFALASHLAFFNEGLNYFEHVVLNCYVVGQQTVLYSLLAVSSRLTAHEDEASVLFILASVAYATVVFLQLFSKLERFSVVLRVGLSYFISFVLFVLVILAVITVAP